MHLESNISYPTTPAQLGWKPFFQQQLTLDEYESCVVARVTAHHRSGYVLATAAGDTTLPHHKTQPGMTVGDWLLLTRESQFVRLLDRESVFRRKAAGAGVAEQLIAANIDTVFIVSSVDQDFSLNRIERYLALVNDAQVEPVIVLTKADLCTDAHEKFQQTQALDSLLLVELVNALDANSVEALLPWCKPGKTIAFIGSSGVGKSTLVNTLVGANEQSTGGVRENDSKGRHTTTARSMHMLPAGGLLLDTPGMREIQLAGVEEGVSETFSEIDQLSKSCRFADCHHVSEPGCAIRTAIEAGELSERRLASYTKLLREQARNVATLAEQRAGARKLGKYYRSAVSQKKRWNKDT